MVETMETMLRILVIYWSMPLVPQIFLYSNYLDPGTGSLVIQIIIASLLGVSFVLKIFWGKVKVFFDKLFSRAKKETD